MALILANMSGVAPKITPELLPETNAQVALNVRLQNGGVAPLREPLSLGAQHKSGIATTIYRFGRNVGENQYWFQWPTAVNVCRGPIAGDSEERTYYTGDGLPKKTKFDLATQGGHDYPMAFLNLAVPAPTQAPVLTQVAGTGPTVQETRAYVYTNVSSWGEESSPSPANIGTADATNVIRVSGFSDVPIGSYDIAWRYIYRSVAASSGTNYYYVGKVAASATEFTDTTEATGIGEPLPSLDWDAPPDDLAGLIALPSGAMCGFSGKEVCFSVIGAPYAYPQKYRQTTDYNIVAVAAMGQGVVVLTDGYPYLINTGDPESAQMVRIDEEQACISARSVVPFGGGVIYASPDGLVSVTSSGATVLTKGLYDRAAWQALNPSSIFAVKHDGRYYGFMTTGGFIFDTDGSMTFHDITATAAFVDPVLDQLYVAVGTNIQRWDSGPAKTSRWKSKRWNLWMPAFTCARIKANSYNDLTLNLYLDGDAVPYFSTPVISNDPFRLPGGFRKRLFELEIVGTDHWTMAAMAGSFEELQRV